MTGTAIAQVTFGSRPPQPGDAQASKILVRLIQPGGAWGPTQYIDAPGGVPVSSQSVFNDVPEGDGYTFVAVAQTDAAENTDPPATSDPFSVVAGVPITVVVGVSGS